MTNLSTDVAIIGGGMVGAALALGLAQNGFTVALIEQQTPAVFNPELPPDVRVSAVSAASIALLNSLGVWQSVTAMRSHPWRELETWEWDNARVVFSAGELGVPVLGHMVENPVLQRALWDAVSSHPAVTCFCPATLRSLSTVAKGQQLVLDSGEMLTARLVVGADGAHSKVREMAGIGIHGWEYDQACMLITVKRPQESGDRTWQQFTPDGPRAWLPLMGNYGSVVWYDKPARIQALNKLPLVQLANEIRAHFPARIGETVVVARGAFPLVRRHAWRYVKQGVALIGDAAHTIHPLAGQGVNLGYRDVEALLDVLINARSYGEDWSSKNVLLRYQARRYPDNILMQTGMDLFYASFSNRLGPVKLARNLGLMAAANAGKVKTQVLKYAIGL